MFYDMEDPAWGAYRVLYIPHPMCLSHNYRHTYSVPSGIREFKGRGQKW